MLIQPLNRLAAQLSGRVSLQKARIVPYFRKASLNQLLIIPFVLQICAAVGLTGYLSFRSGQQAVEDLAQRLIREAGDRVALYLDNYLQTPHLINRLNADAVKYGQLNLQNLPQVESYFFRQLQQFESLTSIAMINAKGDFRSAIRFNSPGDPSEGFIVSDKNRRTLYHIYGADEAGHRSKFVRTFQMPAPQERPWYKAAITAKQETWTPIFQWGAAQELALSGALPLYERSTGKFLGALSSHLTLTHVSKFLNTLKISPGAKIYIVEPDGSLVANSTGEPLYKVSNNANGTQLQRLTVFDSPSPTIRSAARSL